MKWNLKKVIKETNHNFLNFYTLVYDITKDDNTHYEYEYYIASRHDQEHLLPISKNYEKTDGVVMALYYIDEKSGELSLLFTRQFRPSVSTYLTSFPAGLVDKDDKDITTSIKREAKEEAGVNITDIEILASNGTTSSGLSDEMNVVALARITSFGDKSLEEFEDINTFLVKLKDLKEMLNDKKYLFPINIKIITLYLLERFKNYL